MAKRIKGSNVQAVITDGKVTGLAVNGQDIGVLTVKTSGAGVVGLPTGLVSTSSALTYDATGRVATRTDGRGIWTMTYDSVGRLITEVCLDVTRTHSYGTDGRWAGVVEA